MEEWIPRTDLGRRVKGGQLTDINEILDNGLAILEPEITDRLLPGMEHDLLLIGQSKGKFGGGRRRVFRQTQKKTREGNKPRFAAYAVIGNGDGIVGLGYGKARETVPARDKAIRQAKLNVFKIARGSGSWESNVKEPHTVPFTVEGRCGSVRVQLIPAPKGKGLVAEKEVQKILKAAGVQDVWSKTFGQTKNKINLIKATEDALRKLVTTKLRPADVENLSVLYGSVRAERVAPEEYLPQEDSAAKPEKAPAPKAPAEQAAPAEAAKETPSEPSVAPEERGTAGTPLSAVPGVGPARVRKLEAAGIGTAEQLAAADVETIVEKGGMAAGNAERVIAAAKELVEGTR